MHKPPEKWAEINLRKIVNSSVSIREALRKMGLKGAGGNYRQFEFYVRKYSINTYHFRGQGWSKGRAIPKEPVYGIEQILTVGSHYGSHHLKQRLLKLGLKERKCEECGWARVSEDGRIPIELDHINGNHTDNRLENLRILCPNCHSLKPTHRGRNKARHAGVAKRLYAEGLKPSED